MSESLSEARAKSHTLFKRDDFTFDEIRDGNQLAEAVLKYGRSICKRCGRSDEQLKDEYCRSKRR